MKSLVVYSTLTGNTRKIAEALAEALPPGAECFNLRDAPEPEAYDLILPGFWVNRGQADQASLAYLEKIKGQKVVFFFTLGAYPDSGHADEVAADTERRLSENGNQVLGHFRCQGKVDPELLEKMKKMLPPDHPHAQMTPERQARLEEAARHPNEDDLARARRFIADLLARTA
ncbi:MAG: flavodoxin family protein [Candidatus Adiutrix sp.]|jgi:flavodoxin|nr:flavodoxin family protein [Candidatus Adiutrix sp.]